MSRHEFKPKDKVSIPWNGERIDAVVVDVLDVMLFVDFDQGGQGFVYKAEAILIKEESNVAPEVWRVR